MKCPNERCGGKVEEHINDRGGGSRYCLDGCGYEETFETGSKPKPKRDRAKPTPPVRRKIVKKRP